MRTLLAAAAGLAVAASVSAQVPVAALITTDCATVLDNSAERGELYGFKVAAAASAAYTDMLFDLRNTGGMQAGGAATGDAINSQWSIPPNWRVPQVGTDAHFMIMTYPPAAGTVADRIAVDSGTILNQDFGASCIQTVGNSVPSYGGATQSVGISLPGTTATYSVKLRGPASAGANVASFPQGAPLAVELAFAPVVELNTVDPSASGFCAIAGETANPDGAQSAGGGIIIGYNVYRLDDTGSTPTIANFYTASTNANAADGWQYYLPLTRSFNLGSTDTNPGAPGTPAPSDSNPNDLGGLQNPDGVMYNGDEVMIFQDSSVNRGVGRASGTAPVVGTNYWYAFQPVVGGNVSDFAALGFSGGGATFNGNHTLDTNGDTIKDSVNLDMDAGNKIEFFSPQANNAQGGLGLTWNGMPLLSAPVRGAMNPAAAGGQVNLTATISGSSVNITFQTGMEQGNVRGFNVYRVIGTSQMRVNDQLILAQGTESNVYRLVDDATQARRLAKGGVFQYSVEIVHTDGTTSMVGPFDVVLERTAPARRHR